MHLASILHFRRPAAAAVLLAGLFAAAPAGALSIAVPPEGAPADAPRARGRVASASAAFDADGVLRTHVVLVDDRGAEAARFAVPGGTVGGDRWIVDGVPAFVVGETVDVALVAMPAGLTVADGDAAVLRVAPAPGGRSGARFETQGFDPLLAATVSTVDPDLSGASPDRSTVITVRGARFGAIQGESRVTFQGLFERIDAPVLSWKDDEIQCSVPVPGLLGIPQVLTGAIKVWTPEGGWSDGDPFFGGPRFRVLYQWAGDAWPDARLPLPVYVNPRGFPWGLGSARVVAEAMERWNVPGSYARLVYRGLTDAEAGPHREIGRSSADARNTVCWRTPWPHNSNWLAVTWSRIDTLTLERQETDLEINGENYTWSIGDETGERDYDLPSTLSHEFGHWMRLGHTQLITSVMLAFFGAGERRREVTVADAFGASWIYPAYGTLEAPPAIASGAPLDLRVRALDREGQELTFLPAARVVARLIRVPEDGPAPGPLDPAHGDAPAAEAVARAATDGDGWTTARLSGLPDGRYRAEVFVNGSLVRPAPLLRVGAEPAPPAAPALALAGVVPQPLAGGVRGALRFTLPRSAHVRLDLYDVRGARVRALADRRFDAGANEVVLWTRGSDGTTLSPGVYFARLSPVAGLSFAPLTSRVVVLP